MPGTTFRALLSEGARKDYRTDFKQITADALPPGDVLVDVAFSSLNYKDGLAVTGRGDIIRRFPMVCGIDLAGRVIESTSAEFQPGDEVLGVGQGLGELHWGGYSQRARVPAQAILPVPAGLNLKQAMAIGTAGFTAMLSLMALEHQGLQAGGRDVLVTGAGGGVGSVAVALLSARGYRVAASTGRQELHAYLRDLGATTIVDRATLAEKTPPLAPERWAAAIDTVGGQTLASVLAATAAYGAVAACGLVGGIELPTTVIPFILRNVALLGINSVQTPKPVRIRAWERISKELPLAQLEAMTTIEPLSAIKDLSAQILAGKTRGRIVIDVNA
ncbi:MAG TPA: MDR family oxidoreductase [Vicinamibacterales bacterium]|jgi:acrylyl-CoA reductase (NADPH)